MKNFLSIPGEETSKVEYNTITSISELDSVFNKISMIGLCSIDTETDSLEIEKANLVGISLSYHENCAYYIPINHKNYYQF